MDGGRVTPHGPNGPTFIRPPATPHCASRALADGFSPRSGLIPSSSILPGGWPEACPAERYRHPRSELACVSSFPGVVLGQAVFRALPVAYVDLFGMGDAAKKWFGAKAGGGGGVGRLRLVENTELIENARRSIRSPLRKRGSDTHYTHRFFRAVGEWFNRETRRLKPP